MLSEVFEEKVDKEKDEHCLNKAGAGLLVPGARPPGGEDQVLGRAEPLAVRAGLEDSPDQARHELLQQL